MQRQNEINSRNHYIQTFNEFLSAARSFLSDTLQNLNWTEGATIVKTSEKPLVFCPLDSCHRLSSDNINKHIEMCSWHRLGYKDDDVSFPSTSGNIPCSAVAINKILQKDIILRAAQRDPTLKIGENVHDRDVPQTSDRFFSDFTTDERRILYDYVVSKTAGVMPQLQEFNLFMKPEGLTAAMTREQLMAAERDAKRRRIKYRSAKVHTKSKNYSEVLRGVINNQMMAYEDWIKENFGNDNSMETIQLDMKKDVVAKQEKQNMVWIDWDFCSNIHTQWKYIVEKEKRRKENEEKHESRFRTNSSKVEETNHNRRRKKRDESSSERPYHKEDSRKRETGCVIRKDSYFRDSKSLYHHGGKMKKSSRRESYHSRYREDIYGARGNKRDWFNKDHKSECKEKNVFKNGDELKQNSSERNFFKNEPSEKCSIRRSEHQKTNNCLSTRKRYKYDGFDELDQGIQVKEESLEESQKQSCSHHGKSSEYSIDSTESSGSSRDCTQSDFSSDKVKRQKKSKKEHKHKHKKKHRK